MKLGSVIRELREGAEVSQKQLARSVDISIPYLCQIEKDNRNPTIETVEKIALAFDIRCSDLIALAEEKK